MVVKSFQTYLLESGGQSLVDRLEPAVLWSAPPEEDQRTISDAMTPGQTRDCLALSVLRSTGSQTDWA